MQGQGERSGNGFLPTVLDLNDYVELDEDAIKKFRCLRCGRCCSSLIVGPISTEDMVRVCGLNPSYMKYFKDYLRIGERSNVLMAFKIITNMNGDAGGCAFYDRKRKACTIYPHRPEICRRFPFRTRTLAWRHCEWVKRYLKKRMLRQKKFEKQHRASAMSAGRREKNDHRHSWNAWKR